MKKNLRIVIAALLISLTSVGLYFFAKKPSGVASAPSADAPATAPVSEHDSGDSAEDLYQKARSAYATGDLRSAKLAYQGLLDNYGAKSSKEIVDEEAVTYGQLADDWLSVVDCSLEYESDPSQNPERNSQATVDAILKAVGSGDTETLAGLVGCDVEAAVPESEFGRSNRTAVAEQLILLKPTRFLGEKNGGYFALTSGSKEVALMITNSSFALKTFRVHRVIWGKMNP